MTTFLKLFLIIVIIFIALYSYLGVQILLHSEVIDYDFLYLLFTTIFKPYMIIFLGIIAVFILMSLLFEEIYLIVNCGTTIESLFTLIVSSILLYWVISYFIFDFHFYLPVNEFDKLFLSPEAIRFNTEDTKMINILDNFSE